MRSTAPATAPSPREPFPAVLPERLELAEPGVCAGVGDGDQGLVGQSAQRIEDLAGRHLLVGTDGLGRGQAAAATEHRQPGEQAAFVLEQQVVAPVHHRPERLLAGQGGAGTPGEQPEAVAEPFGQGGQRQRTQTGGGELNGQGQVVEPAADVLDDLAACPSAWKPGRTARARLVNSSTAAGGSSPATGTGSSPGMPSGSRLVAISRRPGTAPTRVSASAAASAPRQHRFGLGRPCPSTGSGVASTERRCTRLSAGKRD